MLILLPPSETKRVGGTGSFDPNTLSRHEELGEARAAVQRALEAVSRDEVAAAKALKLGVKNRDERVHNLVLTGSGALPAIERYTGVLYDALDAPSLPNAARAWLDRHVAVQSALFGLIGAGEEIPAYRLSAGSRLPELAQPLKRVWNAAHADFGWDNAGLVLDLRSKDYAALAPLPAERGWFLNVAQRGADGAVRALNHFNKAAKGDLVRRMATTLPGSAEPVTARAGVSRGRLETPEDVVRWGEANGLELSVDRAAHELTLVTNLGAPQQN
ncbi:YaaA family protein [Leucobacter luti]|uniref:YaaA family protein n=1 Tax=Leucobacter luti TaxID=340320 RepID=UPI001C68EC27|nr:peroxide stress protein YaaA [Leucobacter luti]QYM75714.1 peroxide stress protein YaaA [Leucobacter luti]